MTFYNGRCGLPALAGWMLVSIEKLPMAQYQNGNLHEEPFSSWAVVFYVLVNVLSTGYYLPS